MVSIMTVLRSLAESRYIDEKYISEAVGVGQTCLDTRDVMDVLGLTLFQTCQNIFILFT